jgi:hypothetical protein
MLQAMLLAGLVAAPLGHPRPYPVCLVTVGAVHQHHAGCIRVALGYPVRYCDADVYRVANWSVTALEGRVVPRYAVNGSAGVS